MASHLAVDWRALPAEVGSATGSGADSLMLSGVAPAASSAAAQFPPELPLLHQPLFSSGPLANTPTPLNQEFGALDLKAAVWAVLGAVALTLQAGCRIRKCGPTDRLRQPNRVACCRTMAKSCCLSGGTNCIKICSAIVSDKLARKS